MPTDSYFTNLDIAIISKYFTTSEIQSASIEPILSNVSPPSLSPANSNYSLVDFATETNNPNMAQTPAKFLRLAGNQINQKYAGDPLGLYSFIDSINLLKQLAGNNGEFLKQFVVSKLDGKARECVPIEPNSVDEIINALKNAIKPDNSKVIEGRMLAFHNQKLNQRRLNERSFRHC